MVTAGNGLVSSVGLAPAAQYLHLDGTAFRLDDPAFLGVNFKMDFQTDGSGQFDDDRMGWMITDSSTDSANIFGVQLDHPMAAS